MMKKKKIIPTCRLCEKLSEDMTHCAIYGPLGVNNADNTALAASCVASGDYVRLLHAVPNEYNLGVEVTPIEEEARRPDELNDLQIFNSDDFENRHGISLLEWAAKTFHVKEDEDRDS
ncbi:hypothetical protein QP794_23915 [Paenibacillus sp. UMB7766-LJ446]|uniref:hypothetical protein n=1 Tax=Paenibacillus sp. UMB7766-LJ446 TaxID=3046313 RepID=UPI00254F80F4|nr:hypothetical protein [Paenibacillus sp. UMB7766-LJ446]MDK8193139.1 hypothetical protein [Paenibacillus sp. UMB7766-LJ446]